MTHVKRSSGLPHRWFSNSYDK